MTWPTATLGQVAEIVSGATPKTSVPDYWDGDVAWATPKDLSELDSSVISHTPRTITDDGLRSCAARVLPAGSVLFSSRAPIGHVAISAIPMATNQGFKSMIPKEGILDAKYLYHWLRANRPHLESLGNGATFKEVSKAVVSNVAIPLPPIEEQRRIATILDHADTLRTKRRQVIVGLDHLTRSTFDDRFGTRPSDQRVPLSELVEEFRYGTSSKSCPSGSPVLRIPNVVGGSLDITELKTVELSDADRARLALRDGDLLFVRTNGNPDNVGRNAVVSTDGLLGRSPSEFVYASYLIRARLTPGTDPQFLATFLSTNEGRRQLRERSKTSAGQYNINIQGLKSVMIPMVSHAQQAEFAACKQSVDEMVVRVQEQSVVDDELFASLQARAFAGEL